jgi:hypothetical protein
MSENNIGVSAANICLLFARISICKWTAVYNHSYSKWCDHKCVLLKSSNGDVKMHSFFALKIMRFRCVPQLACSWKHKLSELSDANADNVLR